MDKLEMQTPNFTDENIEKLAGLFPNCVTESRDDKGMVKKAIDFDLLKQELSENIVDGPRERYQINWPGKKEALVAANTPINKTLRPCREESVNFDTTENLYIEGDNLEVLKLLQESYLGKIKMIYIDPPYNTGNDFVYNDSFTADKYEYEKNSNQKDQFGSRLLSHEQYKQNLETNGRYHSDWMSMIYPRLKLARNLLKDDGVIFISLDDGESSNLRKICDEVFGADNFIADLIWQKKFSRANDAAYFSTMHDHIFCYAKNSKLNGNGKSWELELLPRGSELPSGYSNPDNDKRGNWTSVVLSAKSGTEKLIYEIVTPSGRICLPPDGRYWSVNNIRFNELVTDNRIWFGKNGDGTPRLKTFLSEVQNGLRPNTIWFHEEVGHNQEGRQEVKKLFDDKGYFDSPKPVRLLSRIIQISNTEPNDIVLDFFSGSSSTAHAMIKFNIENDSNIKFIMVQLPEETDEKSEAYKAGYKNICEIGKERIRRAGNKIKEENAGKEGIEDLDIGFRVLKIDSSNMKDVYYTPDQMSQSLLDLQEQNIKEERTAEDLLFQVLLDWGVDLTLPITREVIKGKTVYFVDEDTLVACFDNGLDAEFAKEIAKRKPLRAVFKESGYKQDEDKINIDQVILQFSPDTEVRAI